jgi:macrolide transport system ATP-binding/permease protein
MGVVCGLGGTLQTGELGTPVQHSPGPVALAFGRAFVTGLLFGFMPARKAPPLDSVVALASE